MTESFRNIEDESFPSFLSNSLGSNSSGVLGNVTLCSSLGLPVAASTIAKIKPGSNNRVPDIQASYLEDGQLSHPLLESLNAQKGKFALSFKDDLEDADDFIAAHRMSDILVKVQQEEFTSIADNIPSNGNPGHSLGLISKPMTDLSTGLPPTHTKEIKASKLTATPHSVTTQEEKLTNEAADRDHFSASISCFLANEKLLSVDGINSNSTEEDDYDDDDIDVDQLLDDGLESYFKQVIPPGMQRGHIEGQELPEAERKLQLSSDGAPLQNQQRNVSARENMPAQSSSDQENGHFQFVDHYEEDYFQIPSIRVAATGMDSCPASDEDTEDELEAVHKKNVLRQRCLLPSTTRQLVGESSNARFRPGLEGGSSDEESCVGVRNASNNSGIEFRRSAEGQVINSPITGGGGDGTSESDEDNGGVATITTFSSNVQTTYHDLRGLGIVGCNIAGEDDHDQLPLQRVGRDSRPAHSEMGDRICPLGTGEAGGTVNRLVPSRSSTTNRRLVQDRQDALDAMDNPEVASASGAEDNLDSLYFRNIGENCKPADQSNSGILQRTQNSFHLSQFVPQYGGEYMDGLRDGPCGYSTATEVLTDCNEEGDENTNAESQPSLDDKYLSPTPKNEDAGDGWNHHLEQKPDWNMMFGNNGEGITAPREDDSHKVVYQNEEGDWVTDLAYYSSFEKEANLLGDVNNLFQDENFLSGTNIIEKIAEDEEEFEKEHCFIQEEKMDVQNISLGDTSWKLPTSNYVLMRASQAPSDFDISNQSYLRLSLGQFFCQRSEALGFLGDTEDDIKRPSFGYFITSPEKRAPFALIRPSDFSCHSSQDQDDTLQFGDEDKTLNPDDLEEQLEENDQLPLATFTVANTELHTTVSVEKGKEFQSDSSCNSSYVTNKTNLPLSISTIASAIADASVSAEPAQLAAMIMELSVKNRRKHLAAGVCESSTPLNQEQSEILESLHKTCPAGEVNMFDMEKYLKKTESVGYDSEFETRSVSPYSFDSPDWADSASILQRHTKPNPPECSERKTLKEENAVNKKQSDANDSTAVTYPVGRNSFNRTNVCDNSVPSCHSLPNSNGQRPLPKSLASGNPATFSAMETRSVCAGQVKPNQKSFENTSGKFVPVKNKTSLKGSDSMENSRNVEQASGNRGASIRCDTGILHVSSSALGPRPATSSHGSLKADKPRTSPHATASKTTAGRKSASSSLPYPRNQSAVPSSDSQRKKPAVKDQEKIKSSVNRPMGKAMPVIDAALSGAEKHVSFVETETGALPAAGKQVDSTKAKLPEEDVQYPEDTQFGFRPSTSPLTHSSPSQVSGMETVKGSSSNSPTSSASSVERRICGSLSPQSDCSSLSLSRLTYVSVYDSTLQNSTISPEKLKNNDTIQLSTTIVRASPTPPVDQDLACVVVPEELKFPNACCVGIASQNSLGMFNPTDRWMQVNIAIHSLSINGEKVDSLPHQWLIVKNKTIIGPKTTEEQKVLFIPPHPGVYQCVLSVSSWPVSADTEVVAQAEAFAGKVLMMAMAETACIEVDVGNSGCLEFGDLTSGSVKALPLKLLNRTHATVPIRLVISANATAWRCFTFCKNPVDVSAESALQVGRISPLAEPSHMNHVMHANYGEEPEEFLVWIHFRAPQKYMSSSGDLGPADEYSARVNIEVDSPGPSHVIESILLHARSGIARIHAPKHLQTVHLSTLLGTTAKQMLPLKNAGNIDVQLKIKISNSEDCFSVKPEDLFLHAGDEQEITISFTSQGNRTLRESVLTILVLPAGPQYEVVLKGEMYLEKNGKSVVSGQSLSSGSSTSTDVPPILSNKQFMAWGGVTLGRAVQQKLVLRNNSLASVQQLRLLIRGQDQDCFQLQSTFGPEERLSSHRELTIRPNEDAAVHLLFAPTRVSCMLAKLEIKQSGMRSTQPGIKFTIPLSGYGGTSNIILEDVKKLSDSYIVTLNGIAPGKVSKVSVCMRNTGSRAAYIKAIPFMDLQTEKLMDSKVISISPQQFVLKERTRKVITVLCKSTRRENELCATKISCLSTICFFCGDEISRQQFRRLLSQKPEAGKQMLPKNSLLKNVIFNERFFEEEQVSEVYDLPQRPNDDQLFYRNMNKVVLLVFGNSEMDTSRSDYADSLQPSPRHSSESDRGLQNPDRHVSNASLDVLPVKGPQGPPLTLSASDKVLNKSLEPQQTWSIQPEQLILSAPSIDGAADTGHVKILNHSTRGLNFELSWPAHCLTITPQHGIIEPQSHLQILVSPNPSLATKPSLLPWSGQIYVQSDNQQKFIKVQILADIALEVSATASSTKQLSVLPTQPETPILKMAKPLPKPPSTNVEIKNKTLIFPTTTSGASSESHLEVENNGEGEVRWYLSSFAPPYVKGVDNSGDVYRATYTAFRCSRVSGTLEAHGKIKVAITFLPRGGGDYAQFWDLECHPITDAHMKHKIRFQLCGAGRQAGGVADLKDSSTLVRIEAAAKARKISGSEASAVKASQDEGTQRGVFAPQDSYTFPCTRVGGSSTLKVNVRNNTFATHMLKFVSPREPFHIKHSKYSLRTQHYINLPVQFRPDAAGKFEALLLIQTDAYGSLAIQLIGEAVD
ncbi:centrosomal protein of 192 kDa isoform X4 [Polyodon spathula]|uniref:centrosomal protein of 192 kDa isoform X4 n=1 Tax=Polyodon spathula TaxID=7913 RepID=UPI001B7D9A98|nr:centrosomal protein of 192 kDa isoform X4 [Polyodon spathula]